MEDRVPRSGRLTVAEFDRFVDAQQDEHDWELVDGGIVMMTNPTENHEQIAGNLGAPLKLAMDTQGCRSYRGWMRMLRDYDGRGRDKPDIVVRCGPRQNRTLVTDPLVIVAGDRRGAVAEHHGSRPRAQALLLQASPSINPCRRSGTSSSSIRIRCGWSMIGASRRAG